MITAWVNLMVAGNLIGLWQKRCNFYSMGDTNVYESPNGLQNGNHLCNHLCWNLMITIRWIWVSDVAYLSMMYVKRGVECWHHCHYWTNRRIYPSFHRVKGNSSWSRWQCCHCCMPASISTWDWQEKYPQQDIQNQNTPMYKIHNALCFLLSTRDVVGRTLINSIQSRKCEKQWRLVCCNCWCLGHTVEHPSSNVVYNRKGVPSKETIHREFNGQLYIVAYCIQSQKCTRYSDAPSRPKVMVEMYVGGKLVELYSFIKLVTNTCIFDSLLLSNSNWALETLVADFGNIIAMSWIQFPTMRTMRQKQASFELLASSWCTRAPWMGENSSLCIGCWNLCHKNKGKDCISLPVLKTQTQV